MLPLTLGHTSFTEKVSAPSNYSELSTNWGLGHACLYTQLMSAEMPWLQAQHSD